MAPYPETETVTIKRIEVALKKRDWTLLKEGISKIQIKFSTNHKWEHIDNWQNILSKAYDSEIPFDIKENFCQLIKNILESRDEELKKPVFEQKELFRDENITYPKLAVVFNETLDTNTNTEIQRHRVNLNNIFFNNEKFSPEPNWIKNISSLVQKLNHTNNELFEFLSCVNSFQGDKTLITNSYSSSIIKNFMAHHVSYSLNDLKTDVTSSNYWKILALGGLTSQFICADCGNKVIDNNFSTMVTASCSKCSGSMYPDLTDINSLNAQINPKVWYQSFNELSKTDVWVLMTPPTENEITYRNLILDAARNAKPKRIYIISNRAGLNEWWKSMLSEILPDTKIMDNFTNVIMLSEEFKNNEMTMPAMYEA